MRSGCCICRLTVVLTSNEDTNMWHATVKIDHNVCANAGKTHRGEGDTEWGMNFKFPWQKEK